MSCRAVSASVLREKSKCIIKISAGYCNSAGSSRLWLLNLFINSDSGRFSCRIMYKEAGLGGGEANKCRVGDRATGFVPKLVL
jgi:hypothetical protein